MTGLLLLSRDNYYANEDGSVAWGPKSDKEWVKKFIKGHSVLVGYNTYQSIKGYRELMASARWTNTPPAIISFGGIKTFLRYPPDEFIVHKTYENLGGGLKLPADFFKGYKLVKKEKLMDYEERTYVKK